MKRDLQTKSEEMKALMSVQGSDGNWNYDSYMLGMYNGMELMLSILEEREPIFRDAPDKWGSEKELSYIVEKTEEIKSNEN